MVYRFLSFFLIVFFPCINGVASNTDSVCSSCLVRNIYLSGNSITKRQIILKEMTFKVGDSLAVNRFKIEKEQTLYNILNTSLFNYVYLNYEIVDNCNVDVYVKVEERWYLWVIPLIEHTDRNISSFLQNGDWSRVNYGVSIQYNNFRGRQEQLLLRVRAGYSNHLLFAFDSPEYKNKMGWGLWIDYDYYDQVPVYTLNDQPVYLNAGGDLIYRSLSNAAYLQLRSGLYQKHRLVINYYDHSISDTILQNNPNFLSTSQTDSEYIELEYRYTHDTRDSKYYPLKGGVREITLSQSGLGIFDSGMNFLSGEAKVSQYSKLFGRLYGGTEWTGNYTWINSVPYFYQNGIGFDDFMRGFEYYVMDGNSYFLAKNKLYFELISPKIIDLNVKAFSKFSKIHYAFYINAFYDMGYVSNSIEEASKYNRMLNNYLYGYGVGIDLVTFYDKAISFNYAGNKFGEHGFFIHLNVKL